MRARPGSVLVLAVTFAGAGALIGWSGLTAALSQEDSVRVRLGEVGAEQRAFRVVYFRPPLEPDYGARTVEAALRGFADVAAPPRRVQVWHSIERNRPRGTRLAVVGEPARDVHVSRGRLPRFGCRAGVCEALALTHRAQVGTHVALGRRRFALVVGRGSLAPGVLPDASQLGPKGLLVRAITPTLEPLVAERGSSVIYSAVLDPERAHAFELVELGERLRRAIVRLERGDRHVTASAPLGLLDDLAERGEVARERLLLVAGQAAALLIAFAAFVASARRRETELADDQLATLGGSRAQVWAARIAYASAPSVAGVLLALGGLWLAAVASAKARGLPGGFVAAALPVEALLALVAAGALGAVLLVASVTPPRRPGFRFGVLELAALAALAVVVWQTTATGALDPEDVAAGGGGPMLLLVPTLAFFAAGVLLLRVLPIALRLAERVARRAPVGVRLAFIGAARSPGQAAAATTFLAVALGGAVFSMGYRATLEQQGRDEARFRAGAEWRVAERGGATRPTVAPLTRYRSVSAESPTPALRLTGELVTADRKRSRPSVNVLALPAARIPELRGWRESFSAASPVEISRRLRPRPVGLTGPRVPADVRALRVWARSRTDHPRRIVLHFLRPGQTFAHLRLGDASRRWRLLRVPLPRSLRQARLIGAEFIATRIPSFNYHPQGQIDLGPIEQRTAGGWSRLGSLANWTETESTDRPSGALVPWQFKGAPIARGSRFDLYGTFQPRIHPELGLPDPPPGFSTGEIPAVASPAVASQAVDGLLTLDLEGKQLPVRIVGTARLFPTVTARPSSFLVLDYNTVFAVMNADDPGRALPNEAWFFKAQSPTFPARLQRAPFRVERLVGAGPLEARLLGDPLAEGTRAVLAVAALLAAALGLIGLLLAARSALASERLQLAEYEALGVPPTSLKRSAQIRLLCLSALGIAAGCLGALASVQLIGALVAVTGTATRPLPPIVPTVPWPAAAAIVGAVAASSLLATALLASRALRDTAARRLRA